MDYTEKSVKRTIRKKCAKCGRIGWYRPRESKCKFKNFGPKSYWCYGRLTRVGPRSKPRERPAGWHQTEEWRAEHAASQAAYVVRHRDRADRALIKAEQRVALARTCMNRLQTFLERWEARVRQAERKLARTDAEILAVQERAAHARHVQQVRRRLQGKPAFSSSTGLVSL